MLYSSFFCYCLSPVCPSGLFQWSPLWRFPPNTSVSRSRVSPLCSFSTLEISLLHHLSPFPGPCQLIYSQPESWELCYIQWEFLEPQTQEAASQATLRTAPRSQRRKPGYIGVFPQRAGRRNIKRLFLIKTIHLRSRNLAFFYIWEDVRAWAHWNHSFSMHLHYLGPVFCFHILSFLRLHHREWLIVDCGRNC